MSPPMTPEMDSSAQSGKEMSESDHLSSHSEVGLPTLDELTSTPSVHESTDETTQATTGDEGKDDSDTGVDSGTGMETDTQQESENVDSQRFSPTINELPEDAN